MMKRRAPAKLNLSLNIVGRRDDGYHLLDSVMVFTRWGDEILLTPAGEFKLTAEGPYVHIFTQQLLSTDKGSPNLIVRAVYLMAEQAGKTPAFHIHVVKNIPAGAGLGGGSSDAAAVMHMLNDYWDMNLSPEELCRMGLALGAELPVCLRAEPTRVRGIGDVLEPLVMPELHVLIAWPDEELLTKDVFSRYRQSGMDFSSFDGDWLQANNDLTAAAIELCPPIGEILSDLQDCDGVIVARMSGSGSACFGIFDTRQAAEAAAPKFGNAVVTSV